jgi:hypothetical protein
MYNVALLIERQLAEIDALQIIELHEGVDDDVTYTSFCRWRTQPYYCQHQCRPSLPVS